MSKQHQAKREAWAKKQEKKGSKLIWWIIGGFIALGLLYMAWALMAALRQLLIAPCFYFYPLIS